MNKSEAFPGNSSAPVFVVLKYGFAPDHQRVKGLELRTVDFGFGLDGNGEIQRFGRRVCTSSGQWEVVKALNREVKRQDLYFSKMWPGEESGGCPSWRRPPARGRQGEDSGGGGERKLHHRLYAASVKLVGSWCRYALTAPLGFPTLVQRGRDSSQEPGNPHPGFFGQSCLPRRCDLWPAT